MGALALLPGCALQPKSLAIAASIWQGYEPLFLAQRQGWLDPGLVHLAEVPSNSSSIHALSSGIVQGAALTLDEVFRARAGGVPLTIVLVLDVSAGADVLLVRPQIKSLPELKGRRIGFEPGSNAALILAKALQQAGLNAGDVKQIPLAIGDHLEAWEHDKVDALITYEPAATRLLAKGAVRIFDSRQIPDTIVDVLALRAEVLTDGYADTIRHLIGAHFKACSFLQQHGAEASKLMAAHLNLAPDQVLQSFAGIKLPDLADNRRLLDGAAPALMQSGRTISTFMVQAKLLAREDSLVDLISPLYLPEGDA